MKECSLYCSFLPTTAAGSWTRRTTARTSIAALTSLSEIGARAVQLYSLSKRAKNDERKKER